MKTYHLLCVQSRHELALCSHSFISVSVHTVTHHCLLFSDSPTPPFSLDPLPPNLFFPLSLVLLLSGTKALFWNGLMTPYSLYDPFLLC